MRVENVEELSTILNNLFKQNTRAYWIELLEKAGVPAGPINHIKEVVDCPQVKAREMVVEVEHPIAGKIKLAGCPIKASLTPCSVQGPPPVLGQDTEKVLKFLGYPEDQITYFKRRKIV
jgi:CoA:oxalate CoA-transferase